ncbi:MAG TPA: hypothetical protein VK179_10815 [Bacteroidales bacterium]|nr:hypothetical protein [Bacteroidales bacterium]
MYYSATSAFDRTSIINIQAENIIPKASPVEVVENSATGSNIIFWSIIGLSAIGVYMLIRYLDSPGYAKSKNFQVSIQRP